MNIVDSSEICPACATGKEKQIHNYNSNTCYFGVIAKIDAMPDEQAAKELRIFKRIPIEMAKMIVALARERKVPISLVFEQEGIVRN